MSAEASTRKPLRLWPGIGLAVLVLISRFVVPMVAPAVGLYAMMGALLGGVLVALWWAFLSRAPWQERLGALLLMAAALVLTPRFLHESLATGGMGILYYVYAVPVLALAFVAWAVMSGRMSNSVRRATMVAAILVSCFGWTLVQTGGITGDGDSDFSWRWSRTPEDRLLAQGDDALSSLLARVTDGDAEAEWPGFRGPNRDSVILGVRIATDWKTSPPVELWRRAIGPGWSSFAVRGDYLYTQEQRGEEEVVSCYDSRTGEPVWRHSDPVRFWESNGGAGPRSTPTLIDGRVYALGGTGVLNVLDASDGRVLWSRNLADDAQAEVPIWGFSSSPLVTGDLVIVAAAGQLVAYDRETGEPRWSDIKSDGYSSPHLMTVDGVAQILMLGSAGAIGVQPADGARLWQHTWSGQPIVQPAATADGDLLLSTVGGASGGAGLTRMAVTRGPEGWTLEERWTSNRLKPYFSDFVVHQGHAYGFDGSILASVDLADGKRNWKGGRYGHGQMVLLADQSVLLVITEEGELALVSATPDKFTEIARAPAIEGKTWNHPVLVNDLLLVRNAEEMAAFRLTLAGT